MTKMKRRSVFGLREQDARRGQHCRRAEEMASIQVRLAPQKLGDTSNSASAVLPAFGPCDGTGRGFAPKRHLAAAARQRARIHGAASLRGDALRRLDAPQQCVWRRPGGGPVVVAGR